MYSALYTKYSLFGPQSTTTADKLFVERVRSDKDMVSLHSEAWWSWTSDLKIGPSVKDHQGKLSANYLHSTVLCSQNGAGTEEGKTDRQVVCNAQYSLLKEGLASQLICNG